MASLGIILAIIFIITAIVKIHHYVEIKNDPEYANINKKFLYFCREGAQCFHSHISDKPGLKIIKESEFSSVVSSEGLSLRKLKTHLSIEAECRISNKNGKKETVNVLKVIWNVDCLDRTGDKWYQKKWKEAIIGMNLVRHENFPIVSSPITPAMETKLYEGACKC